MPRNRPPPASIIASSTFSTAAPKARSAWPTMPAQTRVFTIGSGCGHRRDPIGEFDLADRTQVGGAPGAIHRQPFEVDSRCDVVPAAGIGEELGQQIEAGLGPVD